MTEAETQYNEQSHLLAEYHMLRNRCIYADLYLFYSECIEVIEQEMQRLRLVIFAERHKN